MKKPNRNAERVRRNKLSSRRAKLTKRLQAARLAKNARTQEKEQVEFPLASTGRGWFYDDRGAAELLFGKAVVRQLTTEAGHGR